MNMFMFRYSHRRRSVKKVFLKVLRISQENTCVGVDFYKKETPTQVLSLKICKIFKDIYFKEYLGTTASVDSFS